MKKTFIIANWKSNKTISETEEWLHKFQNGLSKSKVNLAQKEIIVAPSFISLEHANYCAKNLKLSIRFAAQNISPFDEGAYTGEVSAKQIKEFAEYVLIGHSERRTNFSEDTNSLAKKLLMAKKYKLMPIFFIQDKTTQVPEKASIVVYEPPSSISPGIPDTPTNANAIATQTKDKGLAHYVLYGGNVTAVNVRGFTEMPNINGALVGRASLDPLEFLKIVENA